MMIVKFIEKLFKSYIPSSFSIAVVLTLISFIGAFCLTNESGESKYLIQILSYWEKGVWDSSLLVFAYQMILILILGHIIVLSPTIENLISSLTKKIKTSSQALAILSVATMLLAFFNWGMGLIFGAIFARKIGEHCEKNKIKINYALVGAAGYIGLMVWHGGISGSAPIKAAENKHVKDLFKGVDNDKFIELLPENISFSDTILSNSNLITFGITLVIVPIVFWLLNKYLSPTKPKFNNISINEVKANNENEIVKVDSSKTVGIIFGIFVIISFFVSYGHDIKSLRITPNALNLFMFGLAIILHKNFVSFLSALKTAIGGASGILIQFPLYFGIMGIMKYSGLINVLSDFFISISSQTTLPIFTFFSAAIVNIFVPSGGGQWVIQGPIIIEAAMNLGVPIEKVIMSLAYGDQLTNMLQPFWALPLLAITGLKANEILPFTLIVMCVGGFIFVGSIIFIM
ncbi:MAG: short-chain fatty acid transporter [Flavobacteriaceae bacterium]|nr:short-chain fatty acid transporter [Flavobacteriaceae bacterium]